MDGETTTPAPANAHPLVLGFRLWKAQLAQALSLALHFAAPR
jgi:hypothetical protein